MSNIRMREARYRKISKLVVGFRGLTRISPKNFHLTSILPLF